MAVTKGIMFMITTLTLFVLVVGGLGGSVLSSQHGIGTDMTYFKNNHMTDLMNDTYYTPFWLNNTDAHGGQSTSPYALPISNVPHVGTYWFEGLELTVSDATEMQFKLGGADNVYLWVINNPSNPTSPLSPPSLNGVQRDVTIIIYQNWGIFTVGAFRFSGASIINAYDAGSGYSRLVSSGLSFSYQLTVIPNRNTSLTLDLYTNSHYSMFISLTHFDAAKATSGAWGMIAKIMTFSMPNWNPTISVLIGAFIDAYTAITIFLIVRSFVPTLGQLE